MAAWLTWLQLGPVRQNQVGRTARDNVQHGQKQPPVHKVERVYSDRQWPCGYAKLGEPFNPNRAPRLTRKLRPVMNVRHGSKHNERHQDWNQSHEETPQITVCHSFEQIERRKQDPNDFNDKNVGAEYAIAHRLQ